MKKYQQTLNMEKAEENWSLAILEGKGNETAIQSKHNWKSQYVLEMNSSQVLEKLKPQIRLSEKSKQTRENLSLLIFFFHVRFFQVYNVVPSISAVTGISPGRYLWRIVMAFHLGPRLLIAAVYYNFLKSFDKSLPSDSATVLNKLLKGCYYLQICEIIGLCGISFIHNREHYRKSTFFYHNTDKPYI